MAVIHIDYSRNMDESEVISALRALGEPTRLRVVRLLAGAHEGMAAGDIADALKVKQNTMSSHIAALTRCGLIDGNRHGRKIVYKADAGMARRLGMYVLVNLGNIPDSKASRALRG